MRKRNSQILQRETRMYRLHKLTLLMNLLLHQRMKSSLLRQIDPLLLGNIIYGDSTHISLLLESLTLSRNLLDLKLPTPCTSARVSWQTQYSHTINLSMIWLYIQWVPRTKASSLTPSIIPSNFWLMLILRVTGSNQRLALVLTPLAHSQDFSSNMPIVLLSENQNCRD